MGFIGQGSPWQAITGLLQRSYSAIETDWTTNPKVLYAATDTSVFSSADNGVTWSNQSSGLPGRAHCADLRFVVQGDGRKYLYLGTYGRSLWRSEIAVPQTVKVSPILEQVVRILFGVIQDGGGRTTGGPEPPWGEEGVLVIAVAAVLLAQTLPAEIGRTALIRSLQLLQQQAAEMLAQASGEAALGREEQP